jgi:lysozyme
LPYVLDIEEWGNWGQREKGGVIDEISIFIKEFENKSSKSLMIYTNESGFKKYILGHFDQKKIWICSFNDPPNIGKKWIFWQHSHKGKFDFADGWVDINTFNGNLNEWNKYLKK